MNRFTTLLLAITLIGVLCAMGADAVGTEELKKLYDDLLSMEPVVWNGYFSAGGSSNTPTVWKLSEDESKALRNAKERYDQASETKKVDLAGLSEKDEQECSLLKMIHDHKQARESAVRDVKDAEELKKRFDNLFIKTEFKLTEEQPDQVWELSTDESEALIDAKERYDQASYRPSDPVSHLAKSNHKEELLKLITGHEKEKALREKMSSFEKDYARQKKERENFHARLEKEERQRIFIVKGCWITLFIAMGCLGFYLMRSGTAKEKEDLEAANEKDLENAEDDIGDVHAPVQDTASGYGAVGSATSAP